ncbi:hypothetical protein RJ639_007221 [Escallonia herrerae]|uniref:Uncharacterized protein n=1 Tax=Escallonia herrerae TaxID=1293975 RepID=A0AA89AY79_9ASTE|nr:hypothetical protein RJ639_007221 [Escallonia herrerae]
MKGRELGYLALARQDGECASHIQNMDTSERVLKVKPTLLVVIVMILVKNSMSDLLESSEFMMERSDNHFTHSSTSHRYHKKAVTYFSICFSMFCSIILYMHPRAGFLKWLTWKMMLGIWFRKKETNS